MPHVAGAASSTTSIFDAEMRRRGPATFPAGSGARVRAAACASLALLAVESAAPAVSEPVVVETVALDVLSSVQEAREERGVPPLQRRRALDQIALERARAIASRPHGDRLKRESSIERYLIAGGTIRFRSAREQVHLHKNHPEPARGAFEAWRKKRQGWSAAMSAEMDGVGIATVRSSDRWLVMVAILVDDPPPVRALAWYEGELFESVNRVRQRHGLRVLAHSEALAAIARAHSADMASRDYLGHETPEGLTAGDRVRQRGVTFAQLAENIFVTDDPENTVELAVEGWMESPAHRANILDGSLTESAIGAALGDDGTLYFTQLFRTPF